jgi:hypothetical protein
MTCSLILTTTEMQLLQELLDAAASRLLLEIAHTDHRGMKEGLKAREGLLQGVLQKLLAGTASS